MSFEEVMAQLEAMGNESTKKVLMKHGAKEPFFGVKVADLKKIVKKVKKNHELALKLYDTGNSDAMYLAGLIADENKITKEQLQDWAEKAYWSMISEYTVAWVTSESPYAEELADDWINSSEERIASAGWSTWSSIISTKSDEELDIEKIRSLIKLAEDSVHNTDDRVAYTKNGFILAAGACISSLTEEALEAGKRIGKVTVNMGGTACKVPFIPQYLDKMIKGNKIGRKRKNARC